GRENSRFLRACVVRHVAFLMNRLRYPLLSPARRSTLRTSYPISEESMRKKAPLLRSLQTMVSGLGLLMALSFAPGCGGSDDTGIGSGQGGAGGESADGSTGTGGVAAGDAGAKGGAGGGAAGGTAG